jgi:hypothetical protein
MITRIEPPIPVNTPKGKAMAIAWLDYGMENDLVWMCIQDNTGECWQWENAQIRARHNLTLGRDSISPINKHDELSSLREDVQILTDALRDANLKLNARGKYD